MLALRIWKTDGGDALSLQEGDLLLLVQRKPSWALFTIQRRVDDRPAYSVASGVRSSVREAMEAAEAAARRVDQHTIGAAAP